MCIVILTVGHDTVATLRDSNSATIGMRAPHLPKLIIDSARGGGRKVTPVQKTQVLRPNFVRNIHERRRNVRPGGAFSRLLKKAPDKPLRI
jgi:hypothetical protein